MSASKLVGWIFVVAILAALAGGLISDHLRIALQAIHLTQGLWFVGKFVIVALSAGGLLVARASRMLRHAGTGARARNAQDARG